jgi:integrase
MKKLPRFTQKRESFYYTPTINGKTRWISLGKDKPAALKKYYNLEASDQTKTVNEAVELYLRSPAFARLATGSQKKYMAWIDRVGETFGHQALDDVDATGLSRFLHLHGHKAASGISLISNSYKCAILEGWIGWNPVANGIVRVPAPRRIKAVSLEEVLAVRSHLPANAQAIVDISLATALRISDVLALDGTSITERGLVVAIKKTQSEGRVMEFAWTPELRVAARAIPFGMTYRPLQWLWRKALKATGVSDLRIHDMRRWALQEARRRGLSAQTLADHQSGAQTAVYLAGAPIPVKPLELTTQSSAGSEAGPAGGLLQ